VVTLTPASSPPRNESIVFDPLDLLAWTGGGLVLLLSATPFIRRREAERMRRTLEGALGTSEPGDSQPSIAHGDPRPSTAAP
jgi:hypothetical protein